MTDADLTLRDEVAEMLASDPARFWGVTIGVVPERVPDFWRDVADALLPLLARVREEGAAEVRERVEVVLEPVARSQYVSGRRGGKTFLGQFVSELRAALAEPTREERPNAPSGVSVDPDEDGRAL